jgi:hypothetical protein
MPFNAPLHPHSGIATLTCTTARAKGGRGD